MGGLITSDGGSDITSRGVCYGKSPRPKISGLKTVDGRGKGTFISALTGLTPNTLYYARAYATNSEGTGYGNEIDFKTSPRVPPVAATVVTVASYDSISYYYAWVAGRITDDGGASITEKGICWSPDKNPTIIDDAKIISPDTSTNGNGKFGGCKIDSLQPNSVYYARAYVINYVDTSYGNEVKIETHSVPEVSTDTAYEIMKNSALVSGNVKTLADAFYGEYIGYFVEIEIGISYGTAKDPSIDGLHIKSDTKVEGEFKCSLSNLLAGVTYHARSYVRWGNKSYNGYANEFVFIEEEWVVYGNEITFTTLE